MLAQVANLWMSYHSTDMGTSHVSLSLPNVLGIDARPGVAREHALVISAGELGCRSRQLVPAWLGRCQPKPGACRCLMPRTDCYRAICDIKGHGWHPSGASQEAGTHVDQ